MDNIPRQTFSWAIDQTKRLDFTLVEPADDDQDLSLWTLALYVRRKGVLLAVTKTSGDGIAFTDNGKQTGVWRVTLPEEDTTDPDTLNSRVGYYDWALWRTDVDAETPLALGTFELYATPKTR